MVYVGVLVYVWFINYHVCRILSRLCNAIIQHFHSHFPFTILANYQILWSHVIITGLIANRSLIVFKVQFLCLIADRPLPVYLKDDSITYLLIVIVYTSHSKPK